MSRFFALDTAALLGQGRRLDLKRALATRPSLSLVDTRAGQVRVRRQASSRGPRVVFAADGPNVIEHYDGLFAALAVRADVTVFDPPGTGGSAARRGFDFSLDAFAEATIDVLEATGGGRLGLVTTSSPRRAGRPPPGYRSASAPHPSSSRPSSCDPRRPS